MEIRLEQDEQFSRLVMARPPLNTLDIEAVRDIAARARSADTTLPLILAAEGRAFSAGVDTAAYAGYSPTERRALVLAITSMTSELLSHPQPLIAAINGHAMGGGLVLALCCDYRIAGCPEDSRFGLTEARAGVPFPAGPAEVIRHELPPALMRHLTLSSSTASRDEMIAANVFDRICAPDTLALTAEKTAIDLASQPAFMAVKTQVRGALQARVKALADSGEEPFLKAFGAV